MTVIRYPRGGRPPSPSPPTAEGAARFTNLGVTATVSVKSSVRKICRTIYSSEIPNLGYQWEIINYNIPVCTSIAFTGIKVIGGLLAYELTYKLTILIATRPIAEVEHTVIKSAELPKVEIPELSGTVEDNHLFSSSLPVPIVCTEGTQVMASMCLLIKQLDGISGVTSQAKARVGYQLEENLVPVQRPTFLNYRFA